MHKKIVLLLACIIVITSLTWMLIAPGTVTARAHIRVAHHAGTPPIVSISPNIIIFISTSTNHCSSILYINLVGIVSANSCYHIKSTHLSPALTAKFFQDVIRALPLYNLPRESGCLKSISFGTTTIVGYNTTKSIDVSCAADEAGQTIYQDIEKIQSAIQSLPMLTPVPTHYVPTLTPIPTHYVPMLTPVPTHYAPTLTPVPTHYVPTLTPVPTRNHLAHFHFRSISSQQIKQK